MTTKRKLLIWIPVAALLLNGLGYLIVSNMRSASRSAAIQGKGTTGTVGTDAVGAGSAALPAKGDEGTAPRRDDSKDKEETAQARRAAGLVALEAGEYEKALINFTEARALLGDKANVTDLLRVTEELRRRPSGPAVAVRTRPTAPPSPSPAPRSTGRGGSRRTAVREEASAEPAQTTSPTGLLIVSTTPRNLLVQVDDTAIDLTPMRTKVRAGSHRIALLDGDRKVYETTVDIKEGGTSTLLKDLSKELSPDNGADSARVTAPTPSTTAAVIPEEAPRPSTVTSRAPETPQPLRPAPAQARGPSSTGPGTGALQVTSPGLYGVVWINGRPRGYPPLEVRDLPVGPAKVEVRVNGIEKRSSTVVVTSGLTTAVKLR